MFISPLRPPAGTVFYQVQLEIIQSFTLAQVVVIHGGQQAALVPPDNGL